jgi:hypothetical protein
MANGTTKYTVENNGQRLSFWSDSGDNIVSGYFYVFNHAGRDNQTVFDLKVGRAPPGVNGEEEEESPASSVGWVTYGDTTAHSDGSYRLNGNPGSVNDFVRSAESHNRPIYASATFDAGWKDYYPLIEIVGGEGLTSAIPDIGGYSNYKPLSSSAQLHGNSHYPDADFEINNQ